MSFKAAKNDIWSRDTFGLRNIGKQNAKKSVTTIGIPKRIKILYIVSTASGPCKRSIKSTAIVVIGRDS